MEEMSVSTAIISRCVILDHAACANKRASASSWFDFNSGNALASSFWIRYVWLSPKHPLAMIVFPGGISCFASRSFLPMKRTNFLLSLRFARNPLQVPPGYHELGLGFLEFWKGSFTNDFKLGIFWGVLQRKTQIRGFCSAVTCSYLLFERNLISSEVI